jgi:hypothetical protein
MVIVEHMHTATPPASNAAMFPTGPQTAEDRCLRQVRHAVMIRRGGCPWP